MRYRKVQSIARRRARSRCLQQRTRAQEKQREAETVKGFKRLHSVRKSYNEQGLIYFTCQTYGKQPEWMRRKIDGLCVSAGGEYAPALQEYLMTDADWIFVCQKYHISDRTLDRIRKRFYESW